MTLGREKILSRQDLLKTVSDLRSRGKTVVFTNGCFDILHLGHVRLLYEAGLLGDFLVVGINSDDSVRRLKGPSRPLVPEEDRAEILAALEPVSAVTIFPEDTPEELISILKPDIHVKGGDYDIKEIPEAKIVESYGGEVRLIPLVPGHSTTELANKIKNGGGPGL